MSLNPALVLLLTAMAAFSYAFVGHAGGSAYLGLGLLAGLSPVAAKGQALALNLAVVGFSAAFYTRAAVLRWRVLGWLLAGSVPFALLGGRVIPSVPVFKLLAALALAAAALRLFLAAPAAETAPPSGAKLFLLGAALGLLSGVTGVGGGIYLSPILLVCGWAGTRETGAMAAWFILANSLAGLVGYLDKNPLPQVAAPAFVIAALAGALGAWQGSKAPVALQRRALAGITALAALKFLL